MVKIISDTKRERNARNRAMLEEYDKAMKCGSDKTAVYKYLAEKYNLKHTSVCNIIRKYRKTKKR